MTFNPKSHYLTVPQEVVLAFLGATNHWRTVREIAMRTGLGEPVVDRAAKQLAKNKVVQRRPREGGFDNGLPEFKGMRNGDRSRADRVFIERRTEGFMGQVVGVEPLERKLRRILGLRRAREAELIFKP